LRFIWGKLTDGTLIATAESEIQNNPDPPVLALETENLKGRAPGEVKSFSNRRFRSPQCRSTTVVPWGRERPDSRTGLGPVGATYW